MIRILLRLEGLAALITAVVAYRYAGFGWAMFAILLFVPDVFMVGYAKNARLGAIIYNLGHTYIAPFLAFGLSIVFRWQIGFGVALIWVAHIGLDRLLGFGLKEEAEFRDTHLARIGE